MTMMRYLTLLLLIFIRVPFAFALVDSFKSAVYITPMMEVQTSIIDEEYSTFSSTNSNAFQANRDKVFETYSDNFIQFIRTIAAKGLPQGLSQGQWSTATSTLKKGINFSDDIFVHGSRARGTATAASDIDFGIRVSQSQFNAMIKSRFGTPNVGSAKYKTMMHAIETGKITAGRAGLRSLRNQLQTQLGMKVDLSVIRAGSAFDVGPYMRVR